MAYSSPLSEKELLSSVNRFRAFFAAILIILVLISISMVLFPVFWQGNILWGLGSYITLVSVVANRYFDIKKTANKSNKTISLENIQQPSRGLIKKWLTIEKIISFLWILGTILLVTSRWICI